METQPTPTCHCGAPAIDCGNGMEDICRRCFTTWQAAGEPESCPCSAYVIHISERHILVNGVAVWEFSPTTHRVLALRSLNGYYLDAAERYITRDEYGMPAFITAEVN